MKIGRRIGVPILVLAMAAPACIGRGSGDRSSYVLASLLCGGDRRTGCVATRSSGGAWSAAAKGARIGEGSAVRVAPDGTAVLTRGESIVEVRPHAGAPAEIHIVGPGRVAVIAGDVLVDSRPVAPIAVESTGISATAQRGIFRFDRRLSVRVGVYDGEATVSSATGSLPIPRLREGVISARVLPRQPVPLHVSPSDPWDSRLLRDVIDLDRELSAQRRGFESDLLIALGRARARTPAELMGSDATLRALGLELRISSWGFVRPSLRSAGAGDVLIGVVLASLAAEKVGGSVEKLFPQLISMLDAGASWGLLAREFGIAADTVLTAVVRAVGLRTGDAPTGRSTGGTTGGTTGRSATGGTTGQTSGGSTGGTGGSTGGTGGSTGGTSGGSSTGSAGGTGGTGTTGSTDGGSTDGGSTDGGSTDGGSTDGGSTDGGSTDGGSTDGGSTDGSTDGGTDGGDDGGTDGGSTGLLCPPLCL